MDFQRNLVEFVVNNGLVGGRSVCVTAGDVSCDLCLATVAQRRTLYGLHRELIALGHKPSVRVGPFRRFAAAFTLAHVGRDDVSLQNYSRGCIDNVVDGFHACNLALEDGSFDSITIARGDYMFVYMPNIIVQPMVLNEIHRVRAFGAHTAPSMPRFDNLLSADVQFVALNERAFSEGAADALFPHGWRFVVPPYAELGVRGVYERALRMSAYEPCNTERPLQRALDAELRDRLLRREASSRVEVVHHGTNPDDFLAPLNDERFAGYRLLRGERRFYGDRSLLLEHVSEPRDILLAFLGDRASEGTALRCVERRLAVTVCEGSLYAQPAMEMSLSSLRECAIGASPLLPYELHEALVPAPHGYFRIGGYNTRYMPADGGADVDSLMALVDRLLELPLTVFYCTREFMRPLVCNVHGENAIAHFESFVEMAKAFVSFPDDIVRIVTSYSGHTQILTNLDAPAHIHDALRQCAREYSTAYMESRQRLEVSAEYTLNEETYAIGGDARVVLEARGALGERVCAPRRPWCHRKLADLAGRRPMYVAESDDLCALSFADNSDRVFFEQPWEAPTVPLTAYTLDDCPPCYTRHFDFDWRCDEGGGGACVHRFVPPYENSLTKTVGASILGTFGLLRITRDGRLRAIDVARDDAEAMRRTFATVLPANACTWKIAEYDERERLSAPTLFTFRSQSREERRFDRRLYVTPIEGACGSGKTTAALALVAEALRSPDEWRVIWVTPRDCLVQQACAFLGGDAVDIRVARDLPPEEALAKRTLVTTIHSLRLLMDCGFVRPDDHRPHLLVMDEAYLTFTGDYGSEVLRGPRCERALGPLLTSVVRQCVLMDATLPHYLTASMCRRVIDTYKYNFGAGLIGNVVDFEVYPMRATHNMIREQRRSAVIITHREGKAACLQRASAALATGGAVAMFFSSEKELQRYREALVPAHVPTASVCVYTRHEREPVASLLERMRRGVYRLFLYTTAASVGMDINVLDALGNSRIHFADIFVIGAAHSQCKYLTSVDFMQAASRVRHAKRLYVEMTNARVCGAFEAASRPCWARVLRAPLDELVAEVRRDSRVSNTFSWLHSSQWLRAYAAENTHAIEPANAYQMCLVFTLIAKKIARLADTMFAALLVELGYDTRVETHVGGYLARRDVSNYNMKLVESHVRANVRMILWPTSSERAIANRRRVRVNLPRLAADEVLVPAIEDTIASLAHEKWKMPALYLGYAMLRRVHDAIDRGAETKAAWIEALRFFTREYFVPYEKEQIRAFTRAAEGVRALTVEEDYRYFEVNALAEQPALLAAVTLAASAAVAGFDTLFPHDSTCTTASERKTSAVSVCGLLSGNFEVLPGARWLERMDEYTASPRCVDLLRPEGDKRTAADTTRRFFQRYARTWFGVRAKNCKRSRGASAPSRVRFENIDLLHIVVAMRAMNVRDNLMPQNVRDALIASSVPSLVERRAATQLLYETQTEARRLRRDDEAPPPDVDRELLTRELHGELASVARKKRILRKHYTDEIAAFDALLDEVP